MQRVRRHRPSELLPALASTAIQFYDQELWMADRVRLPWALAAAAKASIVYGNEYRKLGVSENDVAEICSLYLSLDTPLRRKTGVLSESVAAFMVRLGHEQFIYQQSEFEEISRLGVLFDNLNEVTTEVLTLNLIEGLLGYSIIDFVGACFVITTGAKMSDGFFDPEWPRLWDGVDSVNTQFPVSLVRQVFHEHFLSNFQDFRETAERFRQSDELLRQHEFNPLVSRPFVTLPDGRHVAPQVHFAFHRMSTSALYFAGLEKLPESQRDAFTRDVGVVFQDYVGRQLRLIPGVTVLPEIFYDNDQRSVDWFVIFDDLVILIEAKSTRLTHLARIGSDRFQEDFDRCVGKAYKQVTRTNDLLIKEHPSFSAIPTDRPRIAIIVTLEPYWAANNSMIKELLPQPSIPTSVAPIRAIEHLVDVVTALGEIKFLM